MTIPLRVAEDVGGGDALPQWMCQARETMFFINYYSSISFLVVSIVYHLVQIYMEGPCAYRLFIGDDNNHNLRL